MLSKGVSIVPWKNEDWKKASEYFQGYSREPDYRGPPALSDMYRP